MFIALNYNFTPLSLKVIGQEDSMSTEEGNRIVFQLSFSEYYSSFTLVSPI